MDYRSKRGQRQRILFEILKACFYNVINNINNKGGIKVVSRLGWDPVYVRCVIT